MRPRSFPGSGVRPRSSCWGTPRFGVYASDFIAYNRGPRRGLSWRLRSGIIFRRLQGPRADCKKPR